MDPLTGIDKWTELLKDKNIKQNTQELENKRKRKTFKDQVLQTLSNSPYSDETQLWNDYTYQCSEEEKFDISFYSDHDQYECQGISSSQEYTGATDFDSAYNPLEICQPPWNHSYETTTQYSSRKHQVLGSYQQLLAMHSNQSLDSDDDLYNQDDDNVSETSNYPSASDLEKHNDVNAVVVNGESKSEYFEEIINIRETVQCFENGDNVDDTETRLMGTAKEHANESDKELSEQAEAGITNTDESISLNHLSCIIAGWKGSGKTTVVQLLKTIRWDDVFEGNGQEKLETRKINSISFIEISDRSLCNVFPVFCAPATVGLLVIDVTKNLQDTVDFGNNTTGRSMPTYREYIMSWLHQFQSVCTSKVNIILVGTYADGYSEKDAIAFMDEILKVANNEKLDKICLSKEMSFTIFLHSARKGENSSNIEKLKACVQNQLISNDHLRKPVSMRWISWFEVLVETCQRKNKVIRVDRVWMLNEKLPIEERLTSMDEVKDVLRFFSDIGRILFEGHYCSIAVLDIQHILDVLLMIISSQIRTGEITSSVLLDMLTQTTKKDFEEITLCLEAIGLASKFPSSDVWYFPTLNTQEFDIADFQNFKSSSVFCFKFNCHAKLIFHMLVCMCLSINNWCVLQDGKMNCVYKNDVVFSLKSHNILIRTCGNRIQIQILWLHEIKVDSALISEIREKIGSILSIIKTRRHAKIKYETGFACGNEPLGKDAFISFEEANGSYVIQCPRCPLRKSHSINVQSITEFWMHGKQQNGIVHNKGYGPKKIDGTPFKKSSLKTTDAKVSDLKSMVSESVCMIKYHKSAIGTGFRVGENLVMTCWHVIYPNITEKTPQGCKLDCDRLIHFNILFQFKDHDGIGQPSNYFSFTTKIHFKDEELDVVVLELERHRFPEVKFPPPINNFCEIDFKSELHLIGHPGGVQMKEDSQVYPMARDEHTYQFILELEKWSMMHCPNNENFYSPLYDEYKVLLHTTFDRGSSGSPGINIHSGKAWVVLMLSGGVPTCFYDETYTNIPHDKLVEYGVSMCDVYRKMKLTNPMLCTKIFPT